MPSSVEILKSLEARGAVLFVREMGFNQSFFEGNSEFVINSLQHGAVSSSAFGQFKTLCLLPIRFFTERSFFYSIRQSNVVAHALTRREQDLFFYF